MKEGRVAQHGIEMILMRRLADHVRMPILLVDASGDLVFFNAAAEPIVGRRFESTGPIRRGEFSAHFKPTNEDGTPMKREEAPLFLATEHRQPSYRTARVQGLDGVQRRIAGIGLPLIGQGDRMLGAVGIFWEKDSPPSPALAPAAAVGDLAGPGEGRPVEVILMRQLASYLATPIFMLGSHGDLFFFNEAAEDLVGQRFDQLDEMKLDDWLAVLRPEEASGEEVDIEERPMLVALRTQRPAHRRFWVRGLDGVKRHVEGSAFPFVGRTGHLLGAVGIFWELGRA